MEFVMQSKISINSANLTYRLVIFSGAVYVCVGLFELVDFFYQKPINFFQMFFFVSIGVGLFEKHSWSRTLCVFSSTITIIQAVILILLGGKVSWNGIPITWGSWYAIVIIIIHSFLLYILLRSDVKSLYSPKENLNSQ